MAGDAPSGRSTATILFTDLVGSTALRAELGEDAADELRRSHDRLLGDAITGQGGRIVKGGGDGLVATFTSASDGLAAAVAGQQAIDRHNRQPRRPARLSVRMGLSAGDVTFEDDDVFGMPVVEAARLEAAADGGQILCAEIVRILARGRGADTIEPIGFLELKGLPEPLAACQVGWTAARAGQEPALPEQLAVEAARPFVGRVDEIAAIDAALDELATGSGLQVIWLSGEPGIGKTRLAAEAARRASHRGHPVLFGRCNEDLAVPYQPIVEALATLADRLADDELATMAGPHGAHLARLVPDLAARAPALTPPAPTTPEADQHRLYEAVRHWLGGLAAPVLVVDDVHWATGPTLGLLAHLARNPAGEGTVVVCTARNTAPDQTEAVLDLLADLDRSGRLHLVEVGGLSAAETAELVGDAARGDRLHAETAGNPLFITTYQAERSGTSALGVAATVRRRLSRLPPAVRQVLESASVAGLQFELPVLAGALDLPERAVLDALDLATAAGITQETGADRYQFTHALVRDALLDGLSASRRARLHGAVGQRLVAVLGPRAIERAAELAHHFAEAVPTVEEALAADYAELAGRRAVDLFSYTEAATALEASADRTPADRPTQRIDRLLATSRAWRDSARYDDAFRTLETVIDEALELGDAGRVVQAAVAHADLAWRLGDANAPSINHLERALSITTADDHTLRASALSALGIAHYLRGEDGRGPAARALELASTGDDRRLLGNVLWRYVFVHYQRPFDAEEMLRHAQHVEAIAGELADEELLMMALAMRASNEVELARPGLGRHSFERLRAVTGRSHDDFWSHGVLQFELNFAWQAGDVGAVEALLSTPATPTTDVRWRPPAGLDALRMFNLRREQDRLHELAPLLDHVLSSAPSAGLWTAGLALLLAELGRADDARDRISELLDGRGDLVVRDDGMRELNCAFLAEAAFLARDPRPAAALVASFRSLRPQTGQMMLIHGSVGCLGPADRWVGLAAAAGGDLATARSTLESAAALCRRIDAPLWLATCLCDLAEATGDQDALDEARRVARNRNWPRVHRRIVELTSPGRAREC